MWKRFLRKCVFISRFLFAVDSDSDSGFSQPKRIYTGSSSLLSPASLHVGSPAQALNNNIRQTLDIQSIRQHTSRYLLAVCNMKQVWSVTITALFPFGFIVLCFGMLFCGLAHSCLFVIWHLKLYNKWNNSCFHLKYVFSFKLPNVENFEFYQVWLV